MRRLGMEEGDEVEVSVAKRSLFGPMRLSKGLAPGVIQLSLGYGREDAGAIGDDVGFNVAVLRTTSSPWITRDVTLRRIGATAAPSPSTVGLLRARGQG